MKASYNSKRILYAMSLREWRTPDEIASRMEPRPSSTTIQKHLLRLVDTGRAVYQTSGGVRQYLKCERVAS